MNIEKTNMPLANNKDVTANDVAKKQQTEIINKQQIPEQSEGQVKPLTIDAQAKYQFGEEEVSGEQLRNWASLGKLDSSERVQTQRDTYRTNYEKLLEESRQRDAELSQYKTQAEIYQKQLEQFQSLLPKQEEQSAIEQLFDQYETTPAPQYQEQEQAPDTMNILRQAFQAQREDLSKLIDTRLSEVDNRLQTVPSRDDLNNIQTNLTRQQEEKERQQQLYLLTNQKMQQEEQRLVNQFGWTPEQAHDYSVVREAAVKARSDAETNATDPSRFSDLYAQAQQLDNQSQELFQKFNAESEAKANSVSEADVSMLPQTWQPANVVMRPEENTKPSYVVSNDDRAETLREAREILKKNKVVG